MLLTVALNNIKIKNKLLSKCNKLNLTWFIIDRCKDHPSKYKRCVIAMIVIADPGFTIHRRPVVFTIHVQRHNNYTIRTDMIPLENKK